MMAEQLKGMLLTQMADEDPQLLNRLRRSGELEDVMKAQIAEAQRVYREMTNGQPEPPPMDEVIAREYAVQALFEWPGKKFEMSDPSDYPTPEERRMWDRIFGSIS